MNDKEQVIRALRGALLLLRRDRTGLEHMSMTVEGFWWSFYAAVIVAPAYALIVFVERVAPGEMTVAEAVSRGGVTYIVSWLVLPVVGLVLTRFYGLTDRYVPLVVATNWLSVWIMAIFLVAIGLSGVLPENVASAIMLVALVAALYLQWFTIQAALETTGSTAITILAVVVVIEQVLQTALMG